MRNITIITGWVPQLQPGSPLALACQRPGSAEGHLGATAQPADPWRLVLGVIRPGCWVQQCGSSAAAWYLGELPEVQGPAPISPYCKVEDRALTTTAPDSGSISSASQWPGGSAACAIEWRPWSLNDL